MKRRNTLRRMLSGLMALAMLAALVAVVPVSAEDEVTTIYSYTGRATEASRTQMLQEFKNNIVNEKAPSVSSAYPQWAGKFYTVNGMTDRGATGFYNSMSPEKHTEGAQHYGLPYEVITLNYKKIKENLKIELSGVPYPIITSNIGALNINMIYLVRKGNSNNVVFDQEMEIRVSLDGENYLPGSVGLRSAKLLGGGVMSTPKDARVLMYELETENLLDIPGLKKGDRIMKIMMMPNGEDTRTFGNFHFRDLKVNTYATKEAFERLVPADEVKTVKLDPKVVRQIPVEEGLRVANTAWHSGSTVYTGSPAGSSTVATSTNYRNYPSGMIYHGPVYDRQVDSTRELFWSVIKDDGEYVGGFNTDTAYGMDCQCFVWNGVSRVSRTYAWAVMITPGNPKTTLLGADFLKTNPHVAFTDYDVTDLNSDQDMFRSYALVDAGDILIHYRTDAGNSVHTRIAKSNHVVYNADGTINGSESYILATEQSSTIYYWVRRADGKEEQVARSSWESFINNNPGAEPLFAYNCYFNAKYTYKSLKDSAYIGYTLDEYKTGEIELEKVDCVFASKDSKLPLWEAGTCISFASNYRIIGYNVKIEDLSTGRTLYQDTVLNTVNYYTNEVYNKEALSNRLKALPNGKYRLSVSVDSGPFTSLEQTKVPTTTKSVEFEVTGRSNSEKVKLDMGTALPAGSTTPVRVTSTVPFDAADVEIKFDESKLTFTGATEIAGQTVKQDGGLVRIVRISAGSSGGNIATLNFAAKADATLADAVMLKSAFVSSAADANTADMTKANDGAEPIPSVGMKDVMPTHWYREAVDYALETGVMSGYSANTFGPNNNLSRAMVVQVLYNKEQKPASSAANPFKDIAGDQWYFNAVRWGADKGVVAGYGGGVFKPDDNVTIEQVAVILHNYAGKPASGGDASAFAGHSDWAEAALKWAAETNLFKGMPFDSVTGPASRAQTAQMLMNYLQAG